MSGTINWYKNIAFDKPNLNSPQPCVHGAGCDYKRKNAEGVFVAACCRGVHPGEEGTGRRLFPARKVEAKDGSTINQPACVRLTSSPYYERRRLRLSWAEWCEAHNLAYTPHEPNVFHEPVKMVGFPKKSQVQAPPSASDTAAMAAMTNLAAGGDGTTDMP